jgi:cytoskeletal protein CcmA (bactofilin family)
MTKVSLIDAGVPVSFKPRKTPVDNPPKEEIVKDVTKQISEISEKATRFLPVDMKDRLKTIFNRTPSRGQAPADEDLPDYSAIFNANKAPGQKKVRFNGPLEPPQLAEPPARATMKETGLQRAQDIEDAEIVPEPTNEPLVRAEQEERRPAPTASQAKAPAARSGEESFAYRAAPKAKAPTVSEEESFAHRATPKPKAPASPEAEPFAHRAAPKKTEAPARGEDESFAHRAAPHEPEPRVEARRAEERKPESHFTSEMWKSHESEHQAEGRKPEHREEPRLQPRARVQAEEPEHEDSALESRFGRLSSTEHVRLKVDPRRSEEREAEEPSPVMASSGNQRALEPVRPYRESAESKPRTTKEHMAAGFAYEAKPLEQPRETHRSSGEPAAPRATASERNLHQQKETSMYAKGQQQESHDNGTATIRTDGANLASIAIERNSKFSGQLKFSGAIAIDGQVEGELVAERVVVHEGGTVNATIEGNTVVVAGTVKGDIYARAELEVLPSGVIHGSVTTPSINVRRGGRIDGRCTIGAPRQ